MNAIPDILANSHGQTLKNHLLACGELSSVVCDHLSVKSDIKNLAWQAAVLHDVGKCSSLFQQKLNNKEIKSVRHNELSYLYFKSQTKLKAAEQKLVGRAIYWHHSTYFKDDIFAKRDLNHIYNELNSQEATLDFFTNCNNLLKEICDLSSIDIKLKFDLEFEDMEYCSERLVCPFDNLNDDRKDENAKCLLIRQILHYVDRTISKLSKEDLDYLVANKNYNDYIHEEVMSFEVDESKLDKARLAEQKIIINSAIEAIEPGAFVNAPAGFGKTLLGLLYAIKLGHKTYWVCPRNAVAESLFESIKDTLKLINCKDISVELFLTGERKGATHQNIDVCHSNIVVTNLDNFLNPTISHKAMIRMPEALFATVIFDEYHEARESDEALLAAFHCVASARLCFSTKYKTMFLSATHAGIPLLFKNSRYKMFPEDNKHYNAVHDKLYKKGTELGNKKLCIRNSISNVQSAFTSQNSEGVIIHSRYMTTHIQDKKRFILNSYGKNGKVTKNVFSGPILKAAMDISFDFLDKSTSSPEDDIQTIGRVNRWGRENSAIINIVDMISDRGESAYIRKFYNTDLAKKWFTHWNSLPNEFTLDQLYDSYNLFHKNNETDIARFLNDRLKNSYDKLKEFIPVYKAPVVENKGFVSAAKTLRSSSASHFVIMKDAEGNWIKEPISLEKYKYEEIKQLDSQNGRSWTLTIKNLPDDILYCFDYSEVLKKENKKKALNPDYYSKRSETPYPTFSLVYDNILGVVKAV